LHADRQAAAKRAKKKATTELTTKFAATTPVARTATLSAEATLTSAPGPGGIPDYFGIYPNWR